MKMEMNFRHIIFINLFLLLAITLSGQKVDTLEKENVKIITEFGMNMTGLINQLVPFKQVTNRTGPYSASLKFIKNKSAFRLGLGMHVISSNFN